MRLCKKCGEEKPLECFNKSGWKDSRRWECTECEGSRKREHYQQNPEPYKTRANNQRVNNPNLKKEEYTRNSGSYKARARARQLRIKGTISDRGISVNALLKRDGSICYLCDEEVDMEAKYPHRLSATIEHVYPISKGGTNTWDNVKLAHAHCNRSKGAKV